MKNRDDILKELREIAPKLSELRPDNVYSVPENYFTQFRVSTLEKIRAFEVQNELQALAPNLAALKKKGAKQVPANYFEAFPLQILNKVSIQKPESSKAPQSSGLSEWLNRLPGFLFKPKYITAFAGSTALLIVAAMMFLKVEQCTDLECKMASLTDEEISNYLDNSESQAMFQNYEGTGLERTKINNAYNDVMSDISTEELDQALLN
jgi:hypothetical protein